MSTERTTLSSVGELAPALSSTASRILGVAIFAVLTAISAKIALPIPGTPVPFTFGPLAVLLAGALLGARLGAASQIVYLTAGVAGLPVFTAGGGAAYLLGPTGGYLMAYPVAAFLVGALAGASVLRTLGGLLAGLAVIYAGGVAWLAVMGEASLAIALGLMPFLLPDLVKVLLALAVTRRTGARTRSFFAAPPLGREPPGGR